MSGVEWLWGLRTCSPDGASYGDFKWPVKGRVEAPDWDPTRRCGGGLHFLAGGVGDSYFLDWCPTALWQVVRAPAAEVVDLGVRAKAPWVEVVYTGDREAATALLARHCPAGSGPIHGATVVAGHHGTATSGDYGTSTAGDEGTATAGYRGTATAGDEGTATAGDWGTATAGEGGTATAGEGGTLGIAYYVGRLRLAIARVGEHAPGRPEGEVIDDDTPYRVVVVDGLPQWRVAS